MSWSRQDAPRSRLQALSESAPDQEWELSLRGGGQRQQHQQQHQTSLPQGQSDRGLHQSLFDSQSASAHDRLLSTRSPFPPWARMNLGPNADGEADYAATHATNTGVHLARKFWAYKLLQKSFSAFERSVKLARIQRRSRKLRAMRMWASSLQRRILRTWKAVVESQNHYREQTLKAYWFWAHYVSRKVIQGFRIHARASRLQRFKAERLRIRLEADQRRRLLLRVWGTWCEVAFRNHRRAERFANERLLWKSLFAWRDTPRQSLLEQEEDRLARATIYHRRKCLNQGLGVLLENKRKNQKEREDEFAAIWFRWHVLTGGAFRNWVKMAKPAILYGQKVNSMRTNRSFVTKNRVFSMWKRHVEDSKKRCEQIAQALRHWARKALATAFHSWVYALTQKVKIRGCEIQAKLAVERLQKNRGIKALKLHLQNRKNSKTLIEKNG